MHLAGELSPGNTARITWNFDWTSEQVLSTIFRPYVTLLHEKEWDAIACLATLRLVINTHTDLIEKCTIFASDYFTFIKLDTEINIYKRDIWLCLICFSPEDMVKDFILYFDSQNIFTYQG